MGVLIEEVVELKVPLAVLVPLCVLYTGLFVIGVAGNVFTVCKLCCAGQRHRHKPMDACICSLAVVDLIIVLLILPSRLQATVAYYWRLGGALCTLSNVAYALSTTMAWVTLGIGAIVICATSRNRPLGAKPQLALAIVLLAVSWLVCTPLSALWGSTAQVHYITFARDTEVPICTVRMHEHWMGLLDRLLSVYYVLLPVAVCTVLACALCCCARHASAATDGATLSVGRTSRMLLSVALVRAVCWLPLHVLFVIGDLVTNKIWSYERISIVWAVLAFWALLPSVVTVFVYVAFGYFRKEQSRA